MTRLLWLAPLLCACGSSNFNSGLPGKTALSDLSLDEVCDLQTRAADWYSTTQDDFCWFQGKIQGIAASAAGEDFTTACEAAVDACQADLDFEDYTCEPTEVPDTCEASVADVEACFSDTVATLAELAKSRCKPVDPLEFAEEAAGLEATPASCEPLGETCLFTLGG